MAGMQHGGLSPQTLADVICAKACQKESGWINGMESMEVELGSKGLVDILEQDGKLTLNLSHLTPGAVVAIEVVFFF